MGCVAIVGYLYVPRVDTQPLPGQGKSCQSRCTELGTNCFSYDITVLCKTIFFFLITCFFFKLVCEWFCEALNLFSWVLIRLYFVLIFGPRTFFHLTSVAEYFVEFLLRNPWEMAYLGLTCSHFGGMWMCVKVFYLFMQEWLRESGVPFDHFFLSPLMPASSLHIFHMLI